MRAIIVEDEFLISLAVADTVGRLGHDIIGSEGRLAAAMELVSTASFDFAIIDCKLHGESVEPLANWLVQRGMPFLIVTAYAEELSPTLKGHPVVHKPYREDELEQGIELVAKRARQNVH